MSELVLCATCGDDVAPDASTCHFCNSTLHFERSEQPATPPRPARLAINDWGNATIAMPKNLAALVTSVDVRDEEIERLATHLRRRNLREERARGPFGPHTGAAVLYDAVDPFAYNRDSLHAATAHLTSCQGCTGSGSAPCSGCGGGGRARCGNCAGSGSERRYYKNNRTRLVKCTVCRGSATVVCAGCGGSGRVTCPICAGSANQHAWLTYDEEERWLVTLTDSPVVLAHPSLRAKRAVTPEELEAFSVVQNSDHPGLLPDSRGIEAFEQHRRDIHPRFDQPLFQQHVRLAVLRRDAHFGFCATRGTLVLSGNGLSGSTTASALRPARVRAFVWLLLVGGIALGTFSFFDHAFKPLPYFQPFHGYLILATWLAVALSIPAVGSLLRELRPGLRFGKLRPLEAVFALGALASSVGALAMAFAATPRLADINKALAANQVTSARLTLDALLATQGETKDALAAEDEVEIDEAKLATSNAKLALLDRVAGRKGARSTTAAQLARAERVALVQAQLDAHQPADALTLVNRWFPQTSGASPDTGELRAKAIESIATTCETAACRYTSLSQASAASPSAARSDALEHARSELLGQLTFAPVPNEKVATRLRRLRQHGELARSAAEVAPNDAAVAQASSKALSFAEAQWARVPLIGAEEDAVIELLGPLTTSSKTLSFRDFENCEVYVVFDMQRHARGAYAIGSKKPRTLGAPARNVEALLSQAVGHAAKLQPPGTPAQTVSRWIEGGTLVVARWRDSTLVELRIGDAAP